MADQRDQTRSSGCHLSCRGFHPAEGHASPGEARILSVIHVFYVAQHQAGADGVFYRLEPGSGPAILPAQRMAQYAGHPPRDAAVGLAPHVRRKTDSCRDALRELRHLWSDLRADGKRAARTRERGVSRLGKVSAAALDLA